MAYSEPDLVRLKDFYQKQLLKNTLPFWFPVSIDREHGGYLLMRDRDGSTSVEMDRHQEGLFPRESWLTWLDEAGFTATSRIDPWERDVFSGRKRDVSR